MKNKILIFIISVFIGLIFNINILQAQQYKIEEIKVDTIKTPKTKTITIVTVWTVPKFIIQFNASYLAGSMELSAHNGGFSKEDFNAGKSFCARNGFGFNLSGKLPLHKEGKFWLDVTGYYNRFVSNLIASNTTEGKVTYNVFGGGAGIDYNFTPNHKAKFFVGGNALLSVISGSSTLYYPDAADSIINVKINSGFRIGYSLFTGLEYAIDKSFGINAGIKYSHLNLLMKSTSTVSNTNATGLNDKSLSTPQLYTGWKQFAYSSVFFGFSYYFNVKEQRYKLPE